MMKPILALMLTAAAVMIGATSSNAQTTPSLLAFLIFPAKAAVPAKTKITVSPFAVPADKEPAGVWQSDTQVLPTAGCHPHCKSDQGAGRDFGDPYTFTFSPRETAPKGYTYRYANPRFVSQWGNGCVFEVWNPFQSNEGGATLNAWARSEPCYFTVALDRFAVELH